MPAPTRPRSTRDRPAKAPLSEGAIVDAALAILASEGLQAVTMRRVAAALDTGPGSLYVYVDGRVGLLQAMQERIIATIELEPPDPSSWRLQLHSLLARTHQALTAHPGIAATTVAQPPTSEAALLLQENLLGLLLAAGMDLRTAAWAADTLAALVTYSAMESDVRRDGPGLVDVLQQRFTDLPRDRFPLLSQNAEQLVAGDAGERFRFAVDAVIDGIVLRGA